MNLDEGIREYLTNLRDQARAESTINARQTDLNGFKHWLSANQDVDAVNDIGRHDIYDYIDYLAAEGYAENTILKSKYISISAAINHLHQERYIDQNPMDRIDRDAIKNVVRKYKDEDKKKDEHGAKDHLDKDVVYQLAESAPEPHVRNELLIKLMFWTGPRVSEVIRVDIGDDGTIDGPGSDINPDKPKIVYYSVKTDEAYPMSYPRQEINPLLRDWVRNGRLRYKRAYNTNRLFVGKKGPISRSRISDVIDKAAKNAGLQESQGESVNERTYHRVTPHILRHSFAMHYHNQEDVSLDKISDALNHSSVETTEDFYAETTEETMINTFGN